MKRNSTSPPKNNSRTRSRTYTIFAVAVLVPALVFISGILFSGCAPDKEMIARAEELVEESEGLVAEYRFADAMEKYDEARSEDGGNVDVYTGIAEIYLLKNRRIDAIDVLTKGTEDSINPSEAYELLGKIRMEDKDLDGSVSNLKKAISKDKNNHSARYLLALAYVDSTDFEEARTYLDIPEDAGEYYVRAQLLRAVLLGRDLDDAEKQLDNLAGFDIDDKDLSKDVSDYLDILEEIKDLDEDESSDKYTDVILAKGALSAGYGGVTIDLLQKYAEIEEEYWEVYLYLGHAYYLDEEYEKAEETLLNAGTLNPVDHLGPWLLGRVYVETSEENQMVDSYLRAIELSVEEERTNIRREFAGLLLNGGNYVEAEEQYIALESEDSENRSEYEICLAEILYNRDCTDDAEAILDKINQASLNDDLRARFLWVKASVYFESGDKESAKKWVEEAIVLDDKTSRYYLLLGQILFEEDLNDVARETFERAVDLDLDGDISTKAMKFLDRI